MSPRLARRSHLLGVPPSRSGHHRAAVGWARLGRGSGGPYDNKDARDGCSPATKRRVSLVRKAGLSPPLAAPLCVVHIVDTHLRLPLGDRLPRPTSSEKRHLINKWLTRFVPMLAALTLTIAPSASDTALPSPADLAVEPVAFAYAAKLERCSRRCACPARRAARKATSTQRRPHLPVASWRTIRMIASKAAGVTGIRVAAWAIKPCWRQLI